MYSYTVDVNTNLKIVESYVTFMFEYPAKFVDHALRNCVLKYPIKSPGWIAMVPPGMYTAPFTWSVYRGYTYPGPKG